MLEDSPKDSVFKKYILNDVASLSALYFTYEFTFRDIPVVNEIMGHKQMHSFKTLGGLVWKLQKKQFESCKVEFKDLTTEEFEMIRTNRVAGRVEMFNGKQCVCG
jgi:hypothetical protein